MENKPNAISLLLSLGCKLLYNSMDMSAIDYAIHYKVSKGKFLTRRETEIKFPPFIDSILKQHWRW